MPTTVEKALLFPDLPRPTAGHGVPASTSTVQQERAAGLEPATTALATQRSSPELCPLDFDC